MGRRFTGLPDYYLGSNPFLPSEGTGEGEGGGAVKDKPPPDGGGYTAPASQADLDRIIGERVARERAKYADHADLKRKAAEHDRALEATKTEHQKAVDAARREGESTASQAANGRLVAAEARALAAAGKWRVSPAAVVKQLDLSAVKVSDSGDVDPAAIKDALAALATAEPGLVDDGKGAKPKPDPTQGPRAATGTAADGLAEAQKRFGKATAAAQS